MNPIEHFEKLLAAGTDNALLRYSLGTAYLNANRPDEAVPHLVRAVEFDPGYSAAWKAYGKALAATGDRDAARRAYEQGIEAAEARGDKQAAKEMRVFLRRLDKQSSNNSE